MSENRWTLPQQQAIEDTGGALLVSAAAGSGKTAVLVARAVRMITREEAPVDADRLLILTFTNAAAEELRGRMARELEKACLHRPADAYLRRQRLLLKRAFIGTIDAFCQQLVHEHFAVLDLPPDVMVGESALMQQLSAQALAETMEAMYQNPDFARFAALYGRTRSDKPAEDAILALYGFTRSLPRPEQALRHFADMYLQPLPLLESAWGRELLGQAQEGVASALKLTANAMDVIAGDEALAGYKPALEQDAQALAALQMALRGSSWDTMAQAANAFSGGKLKAVRGGDAARKNKVKELRGHIKDIIGNIKEKCFCCTELEYQADIQAAAPCVAALVQATQHYADRYMELKTEERSLDFSDFEHFALRLLQDENGGHSVLARQISQRYDAVMVDEYQDTNALQSALYECLARPDGSNLFLVGDVKQSIYRFRSAEPGIFLKKKAKWARYNAESWPAVITLGHNFRSAKAVVDGVNHLFDQLMSPALGDVAYTEEEQLILGQPADGGAFELCLLETDSAAGEAAWVAKRIADMVRKGTPVRTKEGMRPCGYGDFCVLFRAKATMPLFTAELEAQGIPVAADLAGGLLATPEVLPLTAVLRAIDNPGDDIPLAATMLGPLFRFTPDEMTRLRAEVPQGRLWGALAAAEDAKTIEFVAQMRYYKTLAGQFPVGRLCEELAGRTGYLAAVQAMENGGVRGANLLRFIGWAGEASANGRGGLAGFVRLLDAGVEPSSGLAKAVPGHVNLLTIHKSKGLEFPVCFLVDTARPFNKSDLYARVQMHAELGVGLALRTGDTLYPTLPALAIRSRAGRQAQSEEMRVLYVALTRAQDRVVVTLPHKDPATLLQAAATGGAKPDPFLMGRARSMAQWLLPAALNHPAVACPVCDDNGDWLPNAPEPGQEFSLYVVRPSQTDAPEKTRFELTAPPDAALVEQLVAAFAQKPPRAALQQVPVKVSVSALAGKGEETLLRRPSFMYRQALTAAERGTALHAFLQYADFTAAAEDLGGEIARQVAAGFLEPTMADTLDHAGIRAFLRAPLAKRIAAARQVWREYDFLTSIPAKEVQPDLPPPLADAPVLVQGIADLVLRGDDGVEIVDYKTDRNADAETLAARYRPQLELYRRAVEKRLETPVRRLTIWSFALNAEVAL
ncbi:MAG: UvrD-helicase domain-containing protein [Ruminococcaceae bacterium]|nr:UvrD-helicase domain-containing protein [Oscillospiraceae bacterium]